ncbi:ASPIC/UnbV domain-containing protein [Catenulispora subtropica]|uniref:CRTAC1 family protein n=1 Tax=Catenulispora subtropica TaxID=450798 RepID=A0ABN2T2A6_9ACTN
MSVGERIRRLVPAALAVLLATVLAFVAEYPVSAAGAEATAKQFSFTEEPIALPPGYDQQPMKTLRQVNPAYYKIRSWISSVGAGVALNDLVGHGRGDGMCIVDTRTDEVVVTYAPTAPEQDRFTPFTLDPAPLPVDATMAPMGCTPGDYNGDGRMDLLVTYWGRTPVLFLATSGATTPARAAYKPVELIPNATPDGRYHGPQWNTNAVAVGDFAGCGHPDLIIGNYFPDSAVLDPHGPKNVQMPNSLSSANNGGGVHVLRWVGATSGADPSATYVEDKNAVPFPNSAGWTLAIASADLTGTGLPDVYVANDFGHAFMLHNVSAGGVIKFDTVFGERTPTTPKSFVLGNGSFKGMGVDFGDLAGNGRFDMMVSNITTAWGLEESNFVWINQAKDGAAMKKDEDAGDAPFVQRAQQLGLAWTGWCWDVKMADFRNDGHQEVVQTDGFVKGDIDRWPWLQEMAMMNDDLLSNPAMWPNVGPGDDIAGDQSAAFYARNADGKYVNIGKKIGLGVQIPTRGVAIADTTGTGRLDFALSRQWGPPAFYANTAQDLGKSLDLTLVRPSADSQAQPGTGLEMAGTPAYGTTVTIRTADGRTQVSQLDGGSGHTGKRSFGVHFGLGAAAGPVAVHLTWHDSQGAFHTQDTQLSPGSHTLTLTDGIQEAPVR